VSVTLKNQDDYGFLIRLLSCVGGSIGSSHDE